MKKLLYTFLAVSIIFSACEKEESDEEGVNSFAPLIGIWDLDSYEYEGEITLMPTGNQYEYLSNGYRHFLYNDTIQDIVQYTYTNTQITEINDGVTYTSTYDISASNNIMQQTFEENSEYYIYNFSRH